MNIIFTNNVDINIEEPKPASNFVPDWYKNMESYLGGVKQPFNSNTNATIKKCMPVFDSITAGYIITSPADIWVHIKNGKQYFEWAALNLISYHPIEQAPEHPDRKPYAYPKWINPWSIKTPKGYSVLIVQPFHRESVSTILPGIVDTDSYIAPVNFPFVINDPLFEGLIPKGTPIAQVIPFKREKWKMKIGSEKELKYANDVNKQMQLSFFNRYKQMFWTRKEYK
jgi:hypothetical protein